MAISALKQWRNGETFSARDYVYEREQIITEVNRLAGLLTGDSDLDVNSLTANSITIGSTTVTNFNQLGNRSFMQDDEPTLQNSGYDVKDGDLWFDPTP